MSVQTEFVKNNLLVQNYFRDVQKQYIVKEKSTTGKAELMVVLNNEDNLCIEDYDHSKKCNFFRDDKDLGLNKSVDHVIFQNVSGKCVVHLIEMKTTVGARTWFDIKQKVRTSYLNILALAATLDIDIQKVVVYTTYNENKFDVPDTNPRAKVAPLGIKPIDPQKDEWDKNIIHINLGELRELQHYPVLMQRENGVLTGKLDLTTN